MHPSFAEIQTLSLEIGDQLLRLILHIVLRRDIDRKPRLALVMFLVHESLLPLVQAQKHYLRNVQARIILRNNICLTRVEDILSDDWLDIRVGNAGERGRRGKKGLDVLEEDECCRRVAEGRRQEGVVWTEERHAIQWRACTR